MKKTLYILFLLTLFVNINGFKTISETTEYLKTKKEYPLPDNNNLLYPDYSSTYKQDSNNFNRITNKFLSFFGFNKKTWSAEQLEELLKQIITRRINQGYQNNFVNKITPTEKANFIVWGDIQGTAHSLSRSLEQLKKDKYLNNDQQIIPPNTYLVFNGNVISRSAYILETLTMILNLMDKNPNKVFYIKGEHESKENWKNFGLEKELQIKAGHLSTKKLPLEKELKKFLNTLPLALYIRLSPQADNFIRISYFDRNYKQLNESGFATFLKEDSIKNVDTFDLKNKQQQQQQNVTIKAILKGQKQQHMYKKTKGLKRLLPDKGATAWSLLSSPNKTFQNIYEFRNDAFTMLEVNPINQVCLLTLYKQDAIQQEGFMPTIHNLFSGDITTRETFDAPPTKTIAPTTTLPTSPKHIPSKTPAIKTQTPLTQPTQSRPTKQKQLKLGNTIYVTGSESIVAKQVLDGAFLCINNENKTSPVRTSLTYLDDKYNPKQAKSNIENFLKQGINKIFHPAGSILLEGYWDLVKNGDVFVFSGASSPKLRDPSIENLIHYVPSADQSAKMIVEYAITELKLNKFVIIYETEIWGEGALHGAEEALKKYKKKLGDIEWIKISMIPNTLDVTTLKNIAKKIKDYAPEAIVHFPPNPQLQALIRQLDLSFLHGKTILGIESNIERKKIVREKGLKYAGVQNVPDPATSNIEIVKEYRKLALEAGQKLNESSLEPYMGMAILLDIVKKIPGEITKESIITAARKIKNYPFKGLHLNFNNKTGCLRDSVWIDTGEGEIRLYKPKKEPMPTTPTKQSDLPSKKEIVIGSTMDLSGKVIGNDAKEIELGIRMIIDKQNSKNGINGKKIKLVILDDKFEPALAGQNIETLINEYKTDIILSPVGSHPFSGIAPFVLDKKIAVFIPNVGSTLYRKPEYENLILYYDSSYEEGRALIDYLVKTLKTKKLAIFTEQESYSEDALRGAKETLKKYNLKENVDYKIISQKISKKETIKPNQIKNIINQIQNFEPDAIGFLSLASITQPIFLGFKPTYLENKTLFGVSSLIKIKELARNRNLTYISTLSVPDPKKNTNIEIVRLAQKYFKERDYNLNTACMEGFLAAAVFVDLLKKVPGEITKEKLIEQAIKIKDYDFLGLKLNFNPKTRSLSKGVWVDTGTRPPFLYEIAKAMSRTFQIT